MGKIFTALEKAKIIQNKDQNIDKQMDPLPSPLHYHDKKNEERVKNIESTINPMLIAGLDPQSIEAEQFRQLKNNILFPEKGKPAKCIMVTSALPSEGKSFVSSNLAISIAQNIDEHVLLMDCDLRSPSISSLFGISELAEGLSEYLSEAKPLSSLLVRTDFSKLTLLLAGKIPANPSELLSSEQMRRLIKEVKQRYNDRYIIIDTPPPYLTSETGAIARQVDGIIIVIQQGKTQKKDVINIIDMYGKNKILGAVYNFAQKGLGYGYGKYGYGKYGYGVENA